MQETPISTGLSEFRGTERFEIRTLLGAGGMGVVYKVFDKKRNSLVALKTLRTLSPDGLLRFKHEFRSLQDLNHTNLVNLYELISEGGQWFFTMELIEGVDFLRYVRPGSTPAPTSSDRPTADTIETNPGASPFDSISGSGPNVWDEAQARTLPAQRLVDLGRVRAALSQLARGLHALHGGQVVHRDIKPTNIMVTKEGRVVLLDFGLAGDLDHGKHESGPQLVGTVDYMAPEQAAQQAIGPPADWYAVGSLLYEALTGRVPFVGGPLAVLNAKQKRTPQPPRAMAPHTPADLDALCMELLRIDAAARPTGVEVLRRLGLPTVDESPGQEQPFVGRKREVELLGGGFEEAVRGRAVTVFVHGESGVGKSALVRHFTDELMRTRGALVLSGRCHEREAVPYKAFDGVVDALCRRLLLFEKRDAVALLPEHAALLAQVFPVLRRVEAMLELAPPPRQPDRLELRNRVFSSLRELLGRLASRQPLVVVIEDLQWADFDSLALLREVMRAPKAPPLLLVATLRTLPERAAGGGVDAAAMVSGDVRHLYLENLPTEEARELAASLMGGSPDAARAQAIADEAGGHPLFIDELVRHAQISDVTDPGGLTPLRLSSALASRIGRLDSSPRRLLELLAVAGAPLLQEVAARAAEIDFTAFAAYAAALRVVNLVRMTGAGGGDSIEPYNDRVRDAVLAQLDPPTRAGCDERLAMALEGAKRADPEALCLHWRGAGRPEKAARHATLAAENALEAFAFDRAARLYRLSLELAPGNSVEARGLRTKLGYALACAGRGAEAAVAYLAAADGAPEEEALSLRQRAAEQLLHTGHIDEGLETLRGVMTTLGMSVPSTPRRALASLALNRARLWLRGTRFTERAESEMAPRERARIDVSWSLSIGLGTVDTMRGADFQTRNLLLALRAGEPFRVARALALEAAYLAAAGQTHRRSERLLGEAAVLAERLGRPFTSAFSTMSRGFVAFLEGRWKSAYELLARSEAQFRAHCAGATWEIDSSQLFSLWALFYLGGVDTLERLTPQYLAEARDRGDRYALTNLRTRAGHFIALVHDDPALARSDAEDAVRSWSQQHFFAQHYYELFAQVQADLYLGEGAAACQRIEARWPALQGSLLLQVQYMRVEALHLRARAWLAVAAVSDGAERQRRLRAALADARRFGREKVKWAQPLALLVRAGVAQLRGATAEARGLLVQATVAFDAADMTLYAAAARRCHGQLAGSDEGAIVVAAADEWMTGRRIRNPRRLTAMLAPGFG